MARKPGSRAYRDQQRERLAKLGVNGRQLIEQVAVDLMRGGHRPRQAWRLACELTQDEAAARFDQVRAEPNIRMRGSRIAEYERWPMGGVRPSVRALKILATIYETTWDRLVDIDDLEAMPARDRQEFLGRQEASAWIRVVDDAPIPPRRELMDQKEADPTLPISIYLEDARESTIRDVQTVLHALAGEIGFDLILESDPIYGSFWQKFRAKASDPNTQEEIYDRLIKLERAAEVRLLAVPESQANMQNAQGLAAIIESLKGESAAVVQLGPLVVVKTPTPDRSSAILCRTLTTKELRMLEARPDLLRDPGKLMAQLTVTEQDGPIEQAGDAG
jgi:hypothetical protein